MVCFVVRGISCVFWEKDTSAELMISNHFLPFITQPMQVLLYSRALPLFFYDYMCVYVHTCEITTMCIHCMTCWCKSKCGFMAVV